MNFPHDSVEKWRTKLNFSFNFVVKFLFGHMFKLFDFLIVNFLNELLFRFDSKLLHGFV